jgi:hypothetical protein
METRLIPLLHQAEEKLETYRKDNIDVKEAIVTFDKVLSTKANSWNIVETKDWCKKEFIVKGHIDNVDANILLFE